MLLTMKTPKMKWMITAFAVVHAALTLAANGDILCSRIVIESACGATPEAA